MKCAWQEMLSIMPMNLRRDIDRLGRESLQELRLRINAPPELVLSNQSLWLTECATQEMLDFIINAASRYSPWAASTMARGYLTAPGGHRIGICGEVVMQQGKVTGFRRVQSLCIRIARDYSGIWCSREPLDGSVLILGAPGWGKTTLLRDLIRVIAETEAVTVIDERGELFPDGFRRGKRMDLLTGCPKDTGILQAIRTMGPHAVAADEITSEEDTVALLRAAHCGVRLVCTAHAASMREFQSRPVYQRLIKNRIFQTVLVLDAQKRYRIERMKHDA